MERIRKASKGRAAGWATVPGVGRLALRLLALGLLLAGGAAGALLAGPSRAATTTTGATTTGATTTLASPSALVLTGHGWGHGLGLSQWGAYGYAMHGWPYDRILAHYYVGTSLGSATVSTVRVLVAQEKKATLGSTAAWRVADSAGQVVQLDAAAPLVLKADLAVNGQALTPPLTFKSAQPISVDGKAYRGRIVVSAAGKTLLMVDVVGLESYVKGVVPMEMPSNWAPEALKAQAVAARSYALANRAKTQPFDVYGDGRSQVYGGIAAETPTASAAVDATKGQVVLYGGKVADTMFSSSSGGRTASAQETIGVSIPYLVSVTDPYDTLSPYHDWGPVVVDLAKAEKALKLPVAIDDLQVTVGTSGRVRTATVLTGGEPTATLTGNQIRGALGLRSTWFTPTLLQLLPPGKPVTYGGAGSLTGFVRGAAGSVSLEARQAGGTWTPAGDLVVAGDGTFATIVHPQLTTQYRLVYGNARVGLAKVSVAPLVSVEQSTAGLAGTVAPAVAGATVELQQQSATAWTTIASTTTDSAGGWSLPGTLEPGVYRLRCAPGHGLVAGVSPTLQVQ
jgi:stage II sporulation protein D